jgi:hypothetical protein
VGAAKFGDLLTGSPPGLPESTGQAGDDEGAPALFLLRGRSGLNASDLVGQLSIAAVSGQQVFRVSNSL